jgi:SAM-dependent methyltransferase
MEPSVYLVESKVEESHWWFAGRRRLLARVIEGLDLSRDASLLDVGSGTGTNLRLLGEMGFRKVTGVDSSQHAIRFCAEKGLGAVEQGDACALPCEDQSVDLVVATDIIEHLDDDSAALREFRRVLRPGGCAVLTVPAFPSLWGLQDDVCHHKRRYRKREFEARITGAGLDLRTSFYFNYLLFAPIWLARQCLRLFRVGLDSENQVNTPALNAALAWLFAFDVWSAPYVHPFFGVSIFALTERRSQREHVG